MASDRRPVLGPSRSEATASAVSVSALIQFSAFSLVLSRSPGLQLSQKKKTPKKNKTLRPVLCTSVPGVQRWMVATVTPQVPRQGPSNFSCWCWAFYGSQGRLASSKLWSKDFFGDPFFRGDVFAIADQVGPILTDRVPADRRDPSDLLCGLCLEPTLMTLHDDHFCCCFPANFLELWCSMCCVYIKKRHVIKNTTCLADNGLL